MNSFHPRCLRTLLTALTVVFSSIACLSQMQPDPSSNSFAGVYLQASYSGLDLHPQQVSVLSQKYDLRSIERDAHEQFISLPRSITQGNVFIQDSLNIGLESGATGYRLSVDGKIMCEELKVQSSATWPDYVFSENYPLPSLGELETFITQHQHLPNIPSANEIKEEGIMVGEMQRLMMEKIEELTLYIIEQEKRIQSLESRLEHQESRIKN